MLARHLKEELGGADEAAVVARISRVIESAAFALEVGRRKISQMLYPLARPLET